jgi:hypothetical protein
MSAREPEAARAVRLGERRRPVVTVGDLGAIKALHDACAALSAAESAALQEPGARRRFDEAFYRFGFGSARRLLREIIRQQAQPIVVACGSQLVIRSTDPIRRRVGHASRHRSSRGARRPRSCGRGSRSGGNRDGPSDESEGDPELGASSDDSHDLVVGSKPRRRACRGPRFLR